MAAKLGYIQEKTDWARVVETPDSARILPPDRPPRIRFFDGPVGDRIGGWMAVAVLTGLLALCVYLGRIGAVRWRARPPVDWIDYAVIGVGGLVVLGILILAAAVGWMLIAGALPEKCEILVHVSGMVVRRFRGKWQKTGIGRGSIRTVRIAGPHAQPVPRPVPGQLVFLSLLCDGMSQHVQIGRYEYALARDIAQAIVRQHERLAIAPAPRLLDLCDLPAVLAGPVDEPRWHHIGRSGPEVQITPVSIPAQPYRKWYVRACVIAWSLATTLYVASLVLKAPALRALSTLCAVYGSLVTTGVLAELLLRARQRTYMVTPDALVVVEKYRGWQSRSVIQRDTISAVRLTWGSDRALRLEAVRKSGRPKMVPCGGTDAAWELAAILRGELEVPATTPEENATGMGRMGVPTEETVAPAKHYVQVRYENGATIIEKPALGPVRTLLISVLVGVAFILGSIITTSLIIPRVTDREGRGALLFFSTLWAALGLLIVVSAIGEMIESYRFEITETHLVMRRTLPWGVRTEQWELPQIAEVRMEGSSLLVLEDWAGTVRQLVSWGHTPSIRYTAALLRKHLA